MFPIALLFASVGALLSGCGSGSTTSNPGPPPTVATPVFSPAGGSYTAPQSVTISDATAGATIYYTTDGSTPTASSTPYSGTITVSATETIEAIAVASGDTNSAVASATYTINIPVAATPTFSPAAGTYTAAQTVTIADATTGATIYYTTDGSTPTTSSTKYTGAITVSATETIQAIAVASGYTNSAVATAVYTVNLPAATPTFTPMGGTYTSVQTVTISDATAGATIYYTTDGSTPTANSTKYAGAITVSATETIQAIAVASGYSNSAVATAVYTINLTASTPTFTPPGGTYTAAPSVTISDATAGATIYYTTDGSTPTSSSTVYTKPIVVSQSETLKAIATATGYANSPETDATYAITPTSPAPYDASILTIVTGINSGAIDLQQIGTVPGVQTGTKPVLLWDTGVSGVGGAAFTNLESVLTGNVLSNSSSGYSIPDYFADNTGSAIVLTAERVDTTTQSATANSVTTAVTPLNAISLPFTNVDSTTLVSEGNTTQGVAVVATGNDSGLVEPTNVDGSLNTDATRIVKLSSLNTSTTSAATALQMDSNNDPSIQFGDGTQPGDNNSFFDQKGRPVATGNVGFVAPNSSIGTNVPVIPADATITFMPTSDFGAGSETPLYLASQATSDGGTQIVFKFVQAGTDGGEPTVYSGILPGPSGVGSSYGLVKNFLVGEGVASDGKTPSSIIFIDQEDGASKTGAGVWEFKVTLNAAGGPTFTQAGYASIPGAGGATAKVNVTQSTYTGGQGGLFLSSSTLTGVQSVATGLGGNNDLEEAGQAGSAIQDVIGVAVDRNGNSIVQATNASGTAFGFEALSQFGVNVEGSPDSKATTPAGLIATPITLPASFSSSEFKGKALKEVTVNGIK